MDLDQDQKSGLIVSATETPVNYLSLTGGDNGEVLVNKNLSLMHKRCSDVSARYQCIGCVKLRKGSEKNK